MALKQEGSNFSASAFFMQLRLITGMQPQRNAGYLNTSKRCCIRDTPGQKGTAFRVQESQSSAATAADFCPFKIGPRVEYECLVSPEGRQQDIVAHAVGQMSA